MTQSVLELQTNGVSATIERHGARVSSLTIDGRELVVARGHNPLLWGCYPMVPWVGRLDRGRFEFAGRIHQMPVNLEPHAIHGLGLERDWKIGEDGRSLDLDFVDPWPFGGSARTCFDLHPDHMTMTVSVTAHDHPMPVTIGWHPVLRKRVERATADLSFDPSHMWQRGGDGLPTGDRVDVPPGPWDDCFGGVTNHPTVTWGDGFNLTLRASTDTWVVYDETSHALCVEPLSGVPDAFNRPDCPTLAPGETTSLPLTITWGEQAS